MWPLTDVIWDADQFVVQNQWAPSTIRYLPNFLTDHEEALILKEIEESPQSKWISVDGRSKQDWNYKLDKNGNPAAEYLPEWVSHLYRRFMSVKNAFPPGHRTNFMRVNKYLPGQGIPPHVDSRASGEINSLITLASSTLLKFYAPQNDSSNKEILVGSMFLEPKSLLLISGHAYTPFLHGIEATTHDLITSNVFNRPEHLDIGVSVERKIRYSLTLGWYAKFE